MRVLQSAAVRSSIGYVAASTFWSLMAKILVTRFFFDYPLVILMLQTTATLLIVEVLRVLGVLKLAPYSFEKGRHVFVPSLMLSVAQWISVASFEGIGLPSFDSIKRFSPFFVCLGMAVFGRGQQNQRIDANRTLIALGISFAASVTVNLEMSLDRYSLFYGLAAAALQAGALLQFEGLLQNLSSFDILYMHSFNSLVMFLLADIVQDEIRDAFMYMITAAHPTFGGVFALLLIAGIIFQWSLFYCLEKTSALDLQIVSNVRAAFEIFVAYYLSVYLFYDVSPGLTNWIFLFATLGGAVYYFKVQTNDQVIMKGPWLSKA
ncbi:unnamed protein product [Caenorhabditis auriculariae]|uniref:Sugar phosphate transporter domain-containing protein n=1 Tax=Caenorhabditis auriculariae TaxID=2777116 RepID=A0A8S1HHB7_9PELO|nr:unnamed protein product [Caenorhabditis auriculariae]